MPHNAPIEITFSDTQSSDLQAGGLNTLVYTATGGETSFQDDLLIGGAVASVARDGFTYSPVTEFSVATKKEFIYYPSDDIINSITAGTIVYHPGLPAMEPNEDSVVQYIAEGDVGITITEPVTLIEAKNWLKVEVDDDDTIIETLISAARQACEGYTGLSFVAREITAIVNNELGNIRLPYSPHGDIVSMFDAYDNEITSDGYKIQGSTVKRIIYPACNWLKVTYSAGYAVLPKQLKTSVLMQTAWMYQHRGDADASKLGPDVATILKPFRCIV